MSRTAHIFCLWLALATVCACQTNKSTEQIPKETANRRSQVTEESTAGEPKEVITALYKAISQKQYKYAYSLWEDEGAASDLSFDEFVKGYENTVTAEVEFTGDTEIHGAAGSLYAEVPVRIDSRLRSGKQQIFTGTYVLRRTNIEPDETQGDWHIYDAALAPQPADSAE